MKKLITAFLSMAFTIISAAADTPQNCQLTIKEYNGKYTVIAKCGTCTATATNSNLDKAKKNAQKLCKA
jgi:hypothetical protein